MILSGVLILMVAYPTVNTGFHQLYCTACRTPRSVPQHFDNSFFKICVDCYEQSLRREITHVLEESSIVVVREVADADELMTKITKFLTYRYHRSAKIAYIGYVLTQYESPLRKLCKRVTGIRDTTRNGDRVIDLVLECLW